MPVNNKKMNKLSTWRFSRQVKAAVKNCAKNSLIFALIFAWTFLPIGDYLILEKII